MTDIPVPTLDQITGHTVMEKMRTLAKSFIEFANEIKDNVYTEEQVRDYVTSVLLNYYTKEEVDEAIASIDLSDYYTKEEVDEAISDIDLSNYYTKTEVDSKDTALGDRIDNCEDSISDIEDNKQNTLIPISPILIDGSNIELDGYKLHTSYDWNSDIVQSVGSYGIKFKKDVIVAFYNVNVDGNYASFNLSFFKNQIIRNDETIDLIRNSTVNSINSKIIRIPNLGNIFTNRNSSSASKYITINYNKVSVIISSGVIDFYSTGQTTNCNIKIAESDLNVLNGAYLFYR